jgi:hypothetical protein
MILMQPKESREEWSISGIISLLSGMNEEMVLLVQLSFFYQVFMDDCSCSSQIMGI